MKVIVGWLAVLIGSLFVIDYRQGTIPDTSWLITVNERMLNGERLYVDVIETNPPFSIWLYTVPVWLGVKTGIASEYFVHIATYIACISGILLAGRIMWRAGASESLGLIRWSAFFLAIYTILAGGAFSQRDHIGTVLLLPLVALAACRCSGQRLARIGALSVGGVASLGSVLLLIKPHYILVYLLIMSYVLYRNRTSRLDRFPEFIAIGAIELLYLLTVLLCCPEFFIDVLPVVNTTYLASRGNFGILMIGCLPLVPVSAIFLWLSRSKRISDLSVLLLLSSLASLAPYFILAKGFWYHVFPAYALAATATFALLACSDKLQDAAPNQNTASILPRKPSLMLLVPSVLGMFVVFTVSFKPSPSEIELITSEFECATIDMLGERLPFGHPLSRMVCGRWHSPYCSDWLPHYAVHREQELAVSSPQRAANYRKIVDCYFDEKRRRWLADPPNVVVCCIHEFIVQEALVRYGFDELLANYERHAFEHGKTIFLRLPSRSEVVVSDQMAQPPVE